MSPIEPEILLKGRLMEGRTTQPDRRLAFGRAPRWVVRPMLCAVDGVDGRCRPTPLLGPRQDDSSGGIELHDRNLPAAAAQLRSVAAAVLDRGAHPARYTPPKLALSLKRTRNTIGPRRPIERISFALPFN